VIGGRIWSSAGHQPNHRGVQIMTTLTSEFLPPKRARNAKAKLENAMLVAAAARERAAETTRYAAQPVRPMRAPTVRQSHRLMRLSAKS
jgi:hypothetical protein